MFLRDEVALYYLAGPILLTFPLIGIVWGTWGFIWEVLILLAVFLMGRQRGLPLTILFLLIGYGAPFVVYGVTAFGQMSFVPLAGLLGVLGLHKHWPVRVTFFWGAAFAAVIGAIRAKTASNMVNMKVQQYQDAGLLAAMQQQGITETQFRDLLEQIINLYALIVPSLAAIVALIEFGLVFYILRRLLKDDEGRIPFSRWRLPWYTVWGAILGITFYLLGDQFSWIVLRRLGINLMVVYGALTLVLGISLYLYLLQSPKIPRLLKWALIITSFLNIFFSFVSIIFFGLFDLVFNFRRLPEES
jgi:hypothetical protein